MLRTVHETTGWFVIFANGAAGLWALVAHRVPAVRHPTLWWATGVAQIAIVAQVTLGVVLLSVEDLEVSQFHMFYGFVAMISVGLIYSYRQQLEEWLYLLYGGGGLFLMGLGIRAVFLS